MLFHNLFGGSRISNDEPSFKEEIHIQIEPVEDSNDHEQHDDDKTVKENEKNMEAKSDEPETADGEQLNKNH